ncbi:NOL8 [Bugula neritina]|uniref:NOL8 n=1 Tax=Bugula neritina TaxID=10212 RepID=A0A7J7KKC2_BUGNE|nr:NOL8 [Bugula neritina]
MELMRMFVGGLPKHIAEEELRTRFTKYGKITTVDIKNKHNPTGEWNKTFAYLNIYMTQQGFQKCRSQLNNTTWRDGKITIQLAKQDACSKYAEERKSHVESDRNTEADTPASVIPTVKKGAVPGTPLPENENWVVTKYQRVVPVMNIRSKDKKKIIKYDPSKHCHQIKKLDNGKNIEHTNDEVAVSQLSWVLEEQESTSSESYRAKIGNFTDKTNKNTNGRSAAEILMTRAEKRKQAILEDDMEIVAGTDISQTSTKVKPISTAKSIDSNAKPSQNADLSRFDSDSDNDFEPEIKKKTKQLSPKSKNTRRAFPGTAAFSLDNVLNNGSDVPMGSQNKHGSTETNASSNSTDSNAPSNSTDSNAPSDSTDSNASSDSTDSNASSESESGVAEPTNVSTKKKTKNKVEKRSKINSQKSPVLLHKTSDSSTEMESANNKFPENSVKNIESQLENIKQKIPEQIHTLTSFLSSAVQSANLSSVLKEKMAGSKSECDSGSNTSATPVSNASSADALVFLLESAVSIIKSAKKTDSEALSKNLAVLNSESDKPVPQSLTGNSHLAQPSFSSDESESEVKQPTRRLSSSSHTSQDSSSTDDSESRIPQSKPDVCSSSNRNSSSLQNADVSKSKPLMLITKGEKQTTDTSSDSSDSENSVPDDLHRKPSLMSKKTSSCEDNSSANKNSSSVVVGPKANGKVKNFISVAEKRELANQKRLEALANKSKEMKDQKLAIQKSLSNLDKNAANNKRIVFDSDSDDDVEQPVAKTLKTDDPNSSKNKKLLNLQKTFNDDNRFKLTERFLESDSDNEDEAENCATAEQVEAKETATDERRRNLEILQSVVGSKNIRIDHPSSSVSSKAKKIADTPAAVFRDVSSIHFDPTNKAQTMLVNPTTEPKKAKKPRKSKKLEGVDPVVGSELAPEIDSSRFFEVSADLKNSVTGVGQTESKGVTFGFLPDETTENPSMDSLEIQTDVDRDDNPTAGSEVSFNKYKNPFDPNNGAMLFDDESDENDEENPNKESGPTSSSVSETATNKDSLAINTVVDWFFFTQEDPRLKDGAKRFSKTLGDEKLREKWEVIKPKLIENYRLKSKRALKKAKTSKVSIIKKRFTDKSAKKRTWQFNY